MREKESLWLGDKERYLNPPQDTVFPLEYSYYLLGDIQDKVVLDLGCGSGENTALLALRGAKVYALDLSPELIGLAQKRLDVNQISAKNVHFMVGSAYETKLPDESVDVIFGMAILHHLDINLVQKEVYRILRKGGFAIFQEPVRDSKFIGFVRTLIPNKSPDISPYERPLSSQELQVLAAPFENFQQRPFRTPFINFIRVVLPRFYMAAHRCDAKILATMPFLTKYAGTRVLKLTK